MQDDPYDAHDELVDDAAVQAGRRIDPEKLALWSIPAGAVIVAMAFLAGGWAATSGKPASMPRQTIAPVPTVAAPQRPTYAVAPPPPPIVYPTHPDSNVAITPVPSAPRPARAIAPAGPSGAIVRDSFSRPSVASGGAVPPASGFNLPVYRGPSGDPSPAFPADEETVRLARARAEMIWEEQARMDRERAQRIAALDAARRTAARDAQMRQRSRMEAGLLSPPGRESTEVRRRRDSFLGDSDFRDEQSTWGRR
jgi:hypothetical protein